MSKGLRNYPEGERQFVAQRRAASNTKGNGYWGAVSYLNRVGIKTVKPAKKKESPSDIRRREKRAAEQAAPELASA